MLKLVGLLVIWAGIAIGFIAAFFIVRFLTTEIGFQGMGLVFIGAFAAAGVAGIFTAIAERINHRD
jgi:hypothetical protein